MSRSPVSTEQAMEEGVLDRYTEAVLEMGRKILRGQSFSGRERHCVYLNTGEPRFANISAVSGLDFPEDGRGMVVTDWDFDGDPDLWISNRTAPRVRFLRNDTATDNRFIALRLTGNGTTSNRDAIGTRVTLPVGEVTLLRTLKAGEGFLSQSSRWLLFGLGREGAVGPIAVRWPDGSRQSFPGLEPNRFYEIEQGAGTPTVFTPPNRVELTPSTVALTPSTQKMRLRLVSKTPLPRLRYRDLAGADHRVRDHLDKPLLLNLWASWCLPCKAELDELDAAGAHVLALSLDGLGEASPTTHDHGRQFWQRHGYRFAAGFADEGLIDLLQGYYKALFLDWRSFVLPTSFLIDTDGTVGAIYRGPVTVAELEEDIARLRDSVEDRRARAVPFAGRWLRQPRTASPTELARAFITDDMLSEGMAYLEEFGSDHDNPLRPQVFMELAQKLHRRGHTEQAASIAAMAKQLHERRAAEQGSGDE
ncbi:MAG: ASPIC/UnbV domain-containing protein [Acidobacteriota bacterium]